jgi:antagonist of KipI
MSLITAPFTVTPDSDRMGARLDGPNLDLVETGDLLSEAVTPGTLQVPPNGKPILLLGDCQTIGGYPKIAHVITVDLPMAAQLWPGDMVRFHEVSLAEAQERLRERENDFARFRVGLSLQMS